VAECDADLTVRVLASGQIHRALPLTVSLCTAIAARLPGSIPAGMLRGAAGDIVRLAMPSGVLTLAADMARDSHGDWQALSGTFYRTARRLFDGRIYVPV
jgi:2-methylaconitate cis-trans-isomerase PrpF